METIREYLFVKHDKRIRKPNIIFFSGILIIL